MFNIRRFTVLVLGAVFALALFLIVGSIGSIWGDDPGPSVVDAKGKKIDVVDVTDHFPSDPPVVFGTSQLLRTKEGVAFKLDTTGLVAGTGYTLWMFIDDDPDVDHPGGPAGLEAFELRMQMGGEFAAPDGSGQFSSFLPAGAFPAANGLNVLASADGFFDKPKKADILLIVRWHGAAVSGTEYEQTHFINGGSPNMSVQEAFHKGKKGKKK